jgi:hypothetical protein
MTTASHRERVACLESRTGCGVHTSEEVIDDMGGCVIHGQVAACHMPEGVWNWQAAARQTVEKLKCLAPHPAQEAPTLHSQVHCMVASASPGP